MNEKYYTKDFYDEQKSGSLMSAKELVPIVLNYIGKINSVVDFGCGVGTWLSVFKEHGIKNVVGVDGAYVDKNELYINEVEFIEYDMNKPINLNKKFDLAISLEVAEHISKENSKNFIDSICQHSDIILFSAARPGQGGTNHINEQFASHWASMFKQNEYICIDCLRTNIMQNAKIQYCYRQNVMLFVKNTVQNTELCLSLIRLYIPYDMGHPDLLKVADIKLQGLSQLLQMQKLSIKHFFPLAVKSIKRRINHEK